MVEGVPVIILYLAPLLLMAAEAAGPGLTLFALVEVAALVAEQEPLVERRVVLATHHALHHPTAITAEVRVALPRVQAAEAALVPLAQLETPAAAGRAAMEPHRLFLALLYPMLAEAGAALELVAAAGPEVPEAVAEERDI